jgi:hypothetical protein
VSLPSDEVTDGTPTPTRPVRWVLSTGAALSLLGAIVLGLLGTDGAGSLAAALVGLSLTCAIAGLTVLIGAVRAEFRGTRRPRRQVGIGMGLLLLAPVMLVFAAGAAGSA